ncbi:DUF1616 domain-containing protein [Natrinema salaciae]|nr:DUF1616 domain-containing protein [Natrinema salaciae]
MSDNNWWFFDQALVIAVTGALTFGIISGVDGYGRILLTIPLVLFLPGYALVSAVFPDEPNDDYRSFDHEKTGLGNPRLVTGGLEAVERVVLSIIFSVALVSTVTLFASATPRGVTVIPVLSGLAVLTVLLSLIAIGTRYRCLPERRFAPSLSSLSPFFARSQPSDFGRTNRQPYNVAIALGLLLLLASGGFAIANPPEHDGFTELSVETENVSGEIDTIYDSTFTAGEPQELQVTIENREHEERTYTTVVMLQQVRYDGDEATVNQSTELDRNTATVADGETSQQTLEIVPPMAGDDLRLAVLLYNGEPPSEPTAENAYRSLHLPIEVE